MSRELERHAGALARGRTLLRGNESLICLEEPFLLAARSEGMALELAVRRVTGFAFLLSGVVAVFVGVGAAPPHIAAIVAVWLAGAIAARVFIARRRREHGRILIDLEAGTVHAHTLAGEDLCVPLASFAGSTERSGDVDAPLWLMLSADAQRPRRRLRLRLGRGAPTDIRRVVTLLRSHHVPVTAAPDD